MSLRSDRADSQVRAFNTWAKRAGLMDTPYTRQVQTPADDYVVFLGKTQTQADRKRAVYLARTRDTRTP